MTELASMLFRMRVVVFCSSQDLLSDKQESLAGLSDTLLQVGCRSSGEFLLS